MKTQSEQMQTPTLKEFSIGMIFFIPFMFFVFSMVDDIKKDNIIRAQAEKLEEAQQIKARSALQDTLLKNLGGKLPKAWKSLEALENDAGGVSVTITYHQGAIKKPLTPAMESVVMVKTILKELIKQGRNPAKELISVHVHAQVIASGETGTIGVRPLVRVGYNPYADRIEDPIWED